MNLALRKPMTLAEFLAWEERQELRYECDGVELPLVELYEGVAFAAEPGADASPLGESE